jgi:hypothetical protein
MTAVFLAAMKLLLVDMTSVLLFPSGEVMKMAISKTPLV